MRRDNQASGPGFQRAEFVKASEALNLGWEVHEEHVLASDRSLDAWEEQDATVTGVGTETFFIQLAVVQGDG
jgi:hypothetical protein